MLMVTKKKKNIQNDISLTVDPRLSRKFAIQSELSSNGFDY